MHFVLIQIGLIYPEIHLEYANGSIFRYNHKLLLCHPPLSTKKEKTYLEKDNHQNTKETHIVEPAIQYIPFL